MRIGWFCYGFYRTDFIAADGQSLSRVKIIQRLLDQGHEVVWLGAVRRKSVKSPDLLYPEPGYQELYKRCDAYYHVPGQSTTDWLADEKELEFAREMLPEGIDTAIMEMSAMGLHGTCEAKLIQAMVANGTPKDRIFVWDMDNIKTSMRGKMRAAGLDMDEFWVVADYTKRVNPRQGVAFLPYVKEYEREIRRGNGDIAYVGNDYHRRDSMMRYMDTDRAHVYGKFWRNNAEEFMASIDAQFHGPVQPCEVHDVYEAHTVGMQLTRKDYKTLGLIPARMNEIPEAGTIMISNADTKGVNAWIPVGLQFDSQARVMELLKMANDMPMEQYVDVVTRQREMVQKAGTSINDWIGLFTEGIEALRHVGPDDKRSYL